MSRLAAVLASAAFAAVATVPAAPAAADCHDAQFCVCWGDNICACVAEICVWMPSPDPICVNVDVLGSSRTICV